jgi:hypothetical protein
MKEESFKGLVKSLQSFGDISGITFNRKTKHLVAGHQRREALMAIGGIEEATIEITKTFDKPTKRGTVALGTIWVDDEPINYREVEWAASLERKANLAANNPAIMGVYDELKLAEQLNEFRLDDDFSELRLDKLEQLDLSDFDPKDKDDGNSGKLDETQKLICPSCDFSGSLKEFKGNEA